MGDHQSINGVTPFLKLHEGIWADVYKAHDASLDRYVLLKLLNPKGASDASLAERFESEARLMARIQHPNVVAILSYGQEEGKVFFTAEYIEGGSLASLLEARGKLPPAVALQILKQITAGLGAAHRQNICHRDLKPANVLIDSNGRVKLTDFGMASLGQDVALDQDVALGQDAATTDELPAVVGTPAYLPPEQILDAQPSFQGDFFSLGATLYEMLAGRPAFRGTSSSDLFDNLLHYDPIPLLRGDTGIPPALINLCASLLAKDPAQRPADTQILQASVASIEANFSDSLSESMVKTYLEHADALMPTWTLSDRPAVALPLDNIRPASEKRFSKVWLGLFSITLLAIVAFYVLGTTPRQPTETNAVSVQTAPEIVIQEEASEPTKALNALANNDLEAEDIGISNPENAGLDDSPKQVSATGASIQESPPVSSIYELEPSRADTNLTPVLANIPDSDVALDNEAPQEPGRLDVLCTPWCNINIDGEDKGTAPPGRLFDLTPGSHTVTLSNPHYPVFEQTINVTPATSDSVRLSFKDLVATIEIEVFPWAEVIIDSVSYGTIPPRQTVLLTPGEHQLTLKNSELGNWSTTLIVAAGEKRRQPYNLVTLLEN